MKFLLCLILLVTSVANLFARPPGGPPDILRPIDDPAKLLPMDPPAALSIETKLTRFHEKSGIQILVQFHAKSPSPDEDAKPGVYMKALSTRLGTVKGGVLVVYFADEDDWRIWIGDDLAATFVGRPGTAQEFTRNGAIHHTKEELFAAAHRDAEDALSALKKTASADHPPSKAERLKLQTDALLNHLIERLSPPSLHGL